MSFDDDSRWDDVIYMLNYLSMNQWTGVIPFKFQDGRVSRRTLEQLQYAKRELDRWVKREEAAHA